MISRIVCARGAALASALLLASATRAAAQAASRLSLRLDTAQAVAALALLADAPSEPLNDAHWRALLTTEGYRRLGDRERSMKRTFADSSFAAFVRSDTLRARAASLRATLTQWERVDLKAAASRAFAYLPKDARIVATVYIVIKPRTNSFVFETKTNPAIFLYLDPTRSAGEFANTVAHELHHIGFSSVSTRADSVLQSLPDSVRAMADWISAFGEGFAMLAAAGSPTVHPHASSLAADRARWDRDVSNFNSDVPQVNDFLVNVLHKRYPSADSTTSVGMSFFGEQGPWYTVGWKMAVLIEQSVGRAELIRCMADPRRLLATYNQIAARYNERHRDQLARWSPELIAALGPP